MEEKPNNPGPIQPGRDFIKVEAGHAHFYGSQIGGGSQPSETNPAPPPVAPASLPPSTKGAKRSRAKPPSATAKIPSNVLDGILSPFRALKDALSEVPGLKILFGIVAVLAILAIARGWSLDRTWTIVGAILVVLFAFILLVLAKFSSSAKSDFKGPAKTLMWFCVLLFMVWATLLTTVVFAQWPIAVKDLPALGQVSNTKATDSPAPISKPENHEPVLSTKQDPVKVLVTPGVARRPVSLEPYVEDQDVGDTLLINDVRFERKQDPPLEKRATDEFSPGAFGRITRSNDHTMITYSTEQNVDILKSFGRDTFAVDVIDFRDGEPRGGKVTLRFEFIISGDANHSPEVPKSAKDDPDQAGIKWLYNPGKGKTTTIDLREKVRDPDDDPLSLTSVQATSGTATCAEGSLKIVFAPAEDSPEFVDITYDVTDYRPAPPKEGSVPGPNDEITKITGKIRVRVLKTEPKIVAISKEIDEADTALSIDVVTDPSEQSKCYVTHAVPMKTGRNGPDAGPFYGTVATDPNRPWALVYRPNPSSRKDDEFRFSVIDMFSRQKIGENRVTITFKKSD